MKNNIIILLLLLLCLPEILSAQRTYPGSRTIPDEVMWKREVYRMVDLSQGSNVVLYEPAEPQNGRYNVFTTIFRLLAQKKIKAYEYTLDGVEHFDAQHEVKFRDVMDRFGIYYELKAQRTSRDSLVSVHNSDIPSAEVLYYFVKEVWYYDQRTATTGTQVVALCPVMCRPEEFSDAKVRQPMFWVKYDELTPYLSTMQTALSNLNTAVNGSMDDFFAQRLYKGEIYKVANLQNASLSQQYDGDALKQEQQRLEAELNAAQTSLSKEVEENDTISVGQDKMSKQKSNVKTSKTNKKGSSGKSTSSKQNSGTKRELSAPRATVKRERH